MLGSCLQVVLPWVMLCRAWLGFLRKLQEQTVLKYGFPEA